MRCIFLNHPIADTNDNESAQIIIPGAQVGRKNDIFVCSVGAAHSVATRGVYVAIISAKLEARKPEEDIAPGLVLLGEIMRRLMYVNSTYETIGDGSDDKCYISSSFYGSIHFENDCEDLLSLYKRVTGEELDMSISTDSVDTAGDY